MSDIRLGTSRGTLALAQSPRPVLKMAAGRSGAGLLTRLVPLSAQWNHLLKNHYRARR